MALGLGRWRLVGLWCVSEWALQDEGRGLCFAGEIGLGGHGEGVWMEGGSGNGMAAGVMRLMEIKRKRKGEYEHTNT